MHSIEQETAANAKKAKIFATPLVERINDFPAPGLDVDLENLVTYPPKIEPVPVKPLFFDVAFNYLEYPGQAKKTVEQKSAPAAFDDETVEASPKPEEKKRGWFGFGR